MPRDVCSVSRTSFSPHAFQNLCRKFACRRFAGIPRPRNIQNFDSMTANELAQLCRRGIAIRPLRQVQARLAVGIGQLPRECRASGELPCNRHDQRAVRITHVPIGPLRIFRLGRFAQRVATVQRTVLRQPPARTPATMRNAVRDGEIQRRAVHSCLPARDDPLHEALRATAWPWGATNRGPVRN